jgi:hypothetical protein
MGINLNNYEAYFLDYKEGNLDTEKVAELMVFLEAHPELKAEFDSFELITLEPVDPIAFDNKNSLKKKVFVSTQHINDYNYEEWLVANLEGDLSQSEKAELNEFIDRNPRVKLEQNIFRSTILKPETVEYFNKKELKKTGVFLLYRTPIIYAASIAASFLLFFGLLFNIINKPENNLTRVEEMDEVLPLDVDRIVTDGTVRQKIELAENFQIETEAKELNPVELEFEKNAISQLAIIKSGSIPVSENSIIYYVDNRFEQSVMLADKQMFLIENDSPKSFVGRFLSSVTSKLIPDNNIQKKSILEYTVEGYNLLADREVEVERQFDERGKLTAVNVDGEVINLSRKVRSRE